MATISIRLFMDFTDFNEHTTDSTSYFWRSWSCIVHIRYQDTLTSSLVYDYRSNWSRTILIICVLHLGTWRWLEELVSMYNNYEERNSLPQAETIAHDERYLIGTK